MKKVIFICDFATKKKGDLYECESQLASQLVHCDKVAIYEGDEVSDDAKVETKKSKSK